MVGPQDWTAWTKWNHLMGDGQTTPLPAALYPLPGGTRVGLCTPPHPDLQG